MNNEQQMVQEFHETFVHPVPTEPGMLSSQRVDDRARWLTEEISEFKEARTLCGQADAMVDLLYFALGTLVEMGVQAAPLFDIVHRANMAKLWPDGKPRYGRDGKVQKPPTWSDPAESLRREIARQVGSTRETSNATQTTSAR